MDKIISTLGKFLKYLTALLLTLLVGVVFTQVVFRFFESGLNWNEEVARFLYVWVVFTGVAASVLNKSHMALTFLEEKFPKTGIIIQIITWVLSLCFFSVVFWYGLIYSRSNMGILSSSLQIPMGVVYIIIPASSAISLICVVYQIYCRIYKREAVTE
jgi:TRAP-type C4-dicarboxylate transport system permease small subunit